MIAHKSSSPPRPRHVVQIGVIGHRPNRLLPEIAVDLPRKCELVLKTILELASGAHDPYLHAPGPPLLRVISPLAEGSDRIVAEAGRAIGADLQCPLPFHADEYSLDFDTSESKQEFNALLAGASAVFECDGRRNAEGDSYERVGRIVVEQSDFLIAIWDGEPAAGRGGTTQMVEEALAKGVPIIWLHASKALEPQILQADEFGDRSLQPLKHLSRYFMPPHSPTPGEGKNPFTLSRVYGAETHPRFNWGRPFAIFRDLVVKGRLKFGSIQIADFESSARSDWQATLKGNDELPEATQAYLLDGLCPHYAWADGLSNYYSGLFRSSSLAISLFSSLAVFFALMGPLGDSLGLRLNRLPSLIEFALIAAVLMVMHFGRRQRWHERWLNYRQLAERLRQYSYLAPLSCRLPTPQELAHSSADPLRSWVDGMFRAIARDVGIAPGRVDRRYVASVGEVIDHLLVEQIRYHSSNHENMEKLNHRLHHAGIWLFTITMIACVVHVVLGGEAPWLLLLATAPPAFGAGFYAIANQGEFARSGDRSQAMAKELGLLKTKDLQKAVSSADDSFTALREVALRIAEVMISETLDWNLVFRYRPLNLPG